MAKEVLVLIKRSLCLAAALTALTMTAPMAIAGEAGHCVDVSQPRQAIEARHGKWIELTSEQRLFLEGIYAMNPETPPGLPYGDKAVLAQVDGDKGGLVFFIDGDRACTPMAAPAALVSMMDDIATARVKHEGSGL